MQEESTPNWAGVTSWEKIQMLGLAPAGRRTTRWNEYLEIWRSGALTFVFAWQLSSRVLVYHEHHLSGDMFGIVRERLAANRLIDIIGEAPAFDNSEDVKNTVMSDQRTKPSREDLNMKASRLLLEGTFSTNTVWVKKNDLGDPLYQTGNFFLFFFFLSTCTLRMALENVQQND